MFIYILFRNAGDAADNLPWVVQAVDEYSVEECGFPENYVAERAKPDTREARISVKDKDVDALFEPAVIVTGKLEPTQE